MKIISFGTVKKKMLKTIFVVCAMFLLAATLAAAAVVSMRAVNYYKSRINTESGIQEKSYITAGGMEQYIQIRGQDKNNPVILWLHGGPGFPLTYLSYYYQAGIEKDYTIASWEQRGCGRTFYRNSGGNLTIEQLLSDTDEIVDYLRNRFGRDKIIIIGQSWGTVLGTEYMSIHPEKVSAYIGTGQVVDFARGKIFAARKAIGIASAKGAEKDAGLLKNGIDVFSRVHSVDGLDIDALEKMIVTSSKYLKGGGEMSGAKQMLTALASPDMSWEDARWFMFAGSSRSVIGSQKSLVDHMYFGFKADETNSCRDVPACFIQGGCDYITPTELVYDYYSGLTAVKKEMVTIDGAGHTPFLDDPERFCDAVRAFLSSCGE